METEVIATPVRDNKGNIVNIEYVVKTPSGGMATFSNRVSAYQFIARYNGEKPLYYVKPNNC